MLKKTILSAVLLLGSTAFCRAQTQTSPWSVGLQAAAQRYEVRYPLTGINEISFIPAQVNFGYRLTSRLSAQVSFAYRQSSIDVYVSTDSLYRDGVTLSEKYHSLVVPLTFRYTVSRNLEKRLLLDLVGGVAIFHSKHDFAQLSYTTPLVVSPAKETITKAYLTFGLSGRYRFTSHFEGVADLLLTKPVSGGTLSPRFYNAALGVRYNF